MNTDPQQTNDGTDRTTAGNASNPGHRPDDVRPNGNSLLGEKAEKYLREVAPIEDLPDAQDQQEMDETLAGEDPSNG
jgi:hypothetical protein